MDRALALSRAIEVHDGLLEVCHLVPQPVILAGFQLKLLLDILHALIHLTKTQLIHLDIVALLLVLLLELLYFGLAHIDLILIGLHLGLALLEHFTLIVGDIVQLASHFLDLFGLSMVDV